MIAVFGAMGAGARCCCCCRPGGARVEAAAPVASSAFEVLPVLGPVRVRVPEWASVYLGVGGVFENFLSAIQYVNNSPRIGGGAFGLGLIEYSLFEDLTGRFLGSYHGGR